jgi:hypothetical protein
MAVGGVSQACVSSRDWPGAGGVREGDRTCGTASVTINSRCATASELPNRGSFSNSHLRGTRVPVEEPSTASIADSCTVVRGSGRVC